MRLLAAAILALALPCAAAAASRAPRGTSSPASRFASG